MSTSTQTGLALADIGGNLTPTWASVLKIDSVVVPVSAVTEHTVTLNVVFTNDNQQTMPILPLIKLTIKPRRHLYFKCFLWATREQYGIIVKVLLVYHSSESVYSSCAIK